MVENNPHKISTMGQGGSLAAITDASDFPHTGLIKGLSLMARQNIVVKNNSNDFDITQSTANSGTVAVSAGTYLRDGKLYTAQYKTGTTAASFTFGSSELITTYDKGYHLVVVDKNNFILIRKPTVANKVPDYTSGDTIIAIVEYSSTTSSGARNIQFLTTDKTENSVSIAYAAGTGDNLVYTEASAITGTSEGLFISGIGTANVQGADKVLIQDTNAVGVNDVIKSVTAQSIADLAPQGDITGVTAGDGLTGGGNSGAVTLAVGVDDSTIEINSDALRLKDGGVTVGKMAANSVNSDQYVDGSIDHVHLSADCIDGDNIQDDVINSEHIVAGAIDLEHLSSQSVDEDNLYISNAGTNGQFLSKQSGNNGGLTWATVSGGGVALQHMSLYMKALSGNANNYTADGSYLNMDIANTTNWGALSTGNHGDIVLTNATVDNITLAAGGIYDITVTIEFFPASGTTNRDMWLVVSTDTSAGGQLGNARIQNGVSNVKLQHHVTHQVPSTGSDLPIYFAIRSASQDSNIIAFTDHRSTIIVTRIGDSVV